MTKLYLPASLNFLSNNGYTYNKPMIDVNIFSAAVDDNEIQAKGDSSPPSSIEENSSGYVNC